MKRANSYSTRAATTAGARRWIGLLLSAFGVLFLVFDAAVKILSLPQAVEATMALGFPENMVVPIGVLQIILLALYLVPRTAPFGAILWTGYLGAAVAAHVRLANPLFSHVLFPIYIAAFLWAGLWLRDRRVVALLKPEGTVHPSDPGRETARIDAIAL